MAAKLNTKLNYAPQESEELMEGMMDENGETVTGASDVIQKYEEELEINDFPQPVRWKITSRVSRLPREYYVDFRYLITFGCSS